MSSTKVMQPEKGFIGNEPTATTRVDPFAALLNFEESENDKTEMQMNQKERRKKRLSVSAIKKMQAKAAEEARQQYIRQRQEYLRDTKARVQAEWERNHAKALVFEAEFEERYTRFQDSTQRLLEVENSWEEYTTEVKKVQDWEQYVKCDGLPNSSSVPEMNTYIFVWTELDTNCLMNHCIKKTEEVMELLRGLEEVISDPGPDRPPYFLKDMKELRTAVRDLLQEHIDKATFYLFSRIETDMVPINVTTSKYLASCSYFHMSLWAELITPLPSSRVKEVRVPLKITFEELQVVVILPITLLDIQKVMRAMWLNYDHWSDKCRTYDCPPLPSYYSQNMYNLFLSEFDQKVEIMRQREELEVAKKRKVAAIPPEPSLSQEILAWYSEPQKTLSEEILFRECEEEENLGRQVKAILNEFEVNLRERMLLGNLLLLEVLHQPPQAQCFRLKHCVTLRNRPPKLEPVDYYVKYVSPEEPPEEEEDPDLRRVKFKTTAKNNLEDEKNKLITIRFQLSKSVLWFEQPQPASWDPVHCYWSTEDIYDVAFEEEEEEITFRIGRLGLVGLHVNRYTNFPYLDWLFEANDEGGVNFQLKTNKIDLLFKIKSGQVCLEAMENAPSKALNWILGQYHPPEELLKSLKKSGLNLLPGPDATCYIEEIDSKHVVMERNIYQVWGMFSKTFRFKRSKFNQEAGRGKIVFQAQEINKSHQVDFCLIQAAMCSCYVLDINEEGESYSREKAPYMETCIDLYSLLYKYCTGNAKRMSEATSTLLMRTVKDFLSLVRPISFS